MQGRCFGEVLTPEGDDRKNCRCTYYAPAEPDAAQEAAMDELVHLRQEMEETEPEAPEGPHQHCPHYESGRDLCCVCGAAICQACEHAAHEDACGNPHCPCGVELEPEAPLQRLPFTLTYALVGGEQREVTLAGDVSVRLAGNGALIITHESDVRALTEIRPAEGR